MKYSVAELLDMLTIANIKLMMIKEEVMPMAERNEQARALCDTINEQLAEVQRALPPQIQVAAKDILELLLVNYQIFKAVDTVSFSQEDQVVADAGRRAQKLNLLRSKLKQALDEYFEGWSKEVKI